MTRAQPRIGEKPLQRKNTGLAQLLAFWINDAGTILGEEEVVILTLESVRDDIVQATTTDGRRVADAQVVQDYINEQIAELRRLWKIGRDKETGMR